MIVYFGVAYITDKEASLKYGRSISWFQKKRLKKLKSYSPPFIKIEGKVYYSIDKLEKWFKEHIIIYE